MPPLAIADSIELGVQSTLCAPDTTGNIPFFRRLAAVRWAFRWVASIMMRSGFGPSPASPAKMRSNTPHAAPADEAVVQRLVRTIALWRIFPLQAMLDHVDDAAYHAPVINPGDTGNQWEKRRNSSHLAFAQQKQHAHQNLIEKESEPCSLDNYQVLKLGRVVS